MCVRLSVLDQRRPLRPLLSGRDFDALGESELDVLKGKFKEEPKTLGPPYTVTYRFSDGWSKRIVVGNIERPSQSDWWISAADAEHFRELKGMLRPRWDFDT